MGTSKQGPNTPGKATPLLPMVDPTGIFPCRGGGAEEFELCSSPRATGLGFGLQCL